MLCSVIENISLLHLSSCCFWKALHRNETHLFAYFELLLRVGFLIPGLFTRVIVLQLPLIYLVRLSDTSRTLLNTTVVSVVKTASCPLYCVDLSMRLLIGHISRLSAFNGPDRSLSVTAFGLVSSFKMLYFDLFEILSTYLFRNSVPLSVRLRPMLNTVFNARTISCPVFVLRGTVQTYLVIMSMKRAKYL